MYIDNLTKEQIEELSEVTCVEAYGFEGRETFPNCGECMICLCKKNLNKFED